ncbi:unnamed protein product [Oikopleura dioica]|uniref:Uncharacterized protein n=1 Tax=Oikopleura dioica TaxID=34765 RepID=E4XLH5_OIKDI|nr:unnamed protein product [Oikopleura dioica]
MTKEKTCAMMANYEIEPKGKRQLKICSTTENVLKTEKILQNPDADSTAVSTNNKN